MIRSARSRNHLPGGENRTLSGTAAKRPESFLRVTSQRMPLEWNVFCGQVVMGRGGNGIALSG